jgi:cytochrome c oxidase cbb3-type subunit 4
MDINDLRTIITALSFVVFVGIVTWAWSSRQRARFEEAANLPFADADAELPGELPTGRLLKSKENSTGVRS